MKIFSLAFIVWSLYFLTAWLLYKLWHVDFNNWILWNLSPYRGASSLYDVKDKFFFLNLIFVLPVLSLGILLAFLPHFNSSLLRRIRGENSDSTNSGNFHNKQIIDIKRKRRLAIARAQSAWGIGAIVISLAFGLMISFVVEDRIKKYPQLGTGFIPKSEAQRQKESQPQKYVGR